MCSTVFRSDFSSMDLPLSLLDRMVLIMVSAREEEEENRSSASAALVLDLLPMMKLMGGVGGVRGLWSSSFFDGFGAKAAPSHRVMRVRGAHKRAKSMCKSFNLIRYIVRSPRKSCPHPFHVNET